MTHTGGIELLGNLMTMPALPYDYMNSAPSETYVSVFRSMGDLSTHEMLAYFSKAIHQSLNDTSGLWSSMASEPRLQRLTVIQG